MKIRFFAALLVAALSFAMMTGCSAPTEAQVEIMEEKIENRLDRAEDNIENRLDAAEKTIIDTLIPAAPAPTVPSVTEPFSVMPPATEPAPASAKPAPTPADRTLISKEEAIAIALTDAGFTQEQVTRLRAEFDYDDGRPEYEVDFRQGKFEFDYEIHAESGAILSKDIDREDTKD